MKMACFSAEGGTLAVIVRRKLDWSLLPTSERRLMNLLRWREQNRLAEKRGGIGRGNYRPCFLPGYREHSALRTLQTYWRLHPRPLILVERLSRELDCQYMAETLDQNQRARV